MSALINAAELKDILMQPQVRILDASYGLPPSPLGIPGAIDFDIDDIADPAAPLAHTIPPEKVFAGKVGKLGIGNDALVIVYDRAGIYMAASRAWWMFRLFGHENIRVLDGGLPAWIRAGGAVAKKDRPPPAAAFKTRIIPERIKFLNQIKDNLEDRHFTVLDARDAGRFSGETPDPRPHVQSGHIPGSLNVPFMSLLNPDGTLKPRDHLEKTLQTARVPLKNALACSCGSGVTACVIALALYELGDTEAAVYDGSWTEWGSSPVLPKAKGA